MTEARCNASAAAGGAAIRRAATPRWAPPPALRARLAVGPLVLGIACAPAAAAGARSVTEFGAAAAADDNAAAIQKGIDAVAAAGGGRLTIPEGAFRTGPITLASGVELHLEAGSRLASVIAPGHGGDADRDVPALVTIANAENVSLTGEGTIDGRGEAWWSAFLAAKAARQELRRPQLIRIDRSRNVELSGITTLNPPNTHVSARDSEDVAFRGLTMTAPDDSPNTDAINLGRMRRVLIERCIISTGDDNVAIIASGKPGDGAGSEDITVRDCRFGCGHGLSIGSYTQAGIRRLRVSNVTFDGTTSGIRLKSNAGRGGAVQDLEYRDLTMRNVRYPIFLASHYPKLPASPGEATAVGTHLPRWSDILIENVAIRDCRNGPVVWGLPEAPVERLAFRRVTVESDEGGVMVHAHATFDDSSMQPRTGPALRAFDAVVTGIETAPLEGRYKPR